MKRTINVVKMWFALGVALYFAFAVAGNFTYWTLTYFNPANWVELVRSLFVVCWFVLLSVSWLLVPSCKIMNGE